MAEMSSADIVADVEMYATAILQQRVEASLQSAFKTLPTANMGILNCLPPELMTLVLHMLDLRSFFAFRQVNRQSRMISTGLREYNLVSQPGLEGLRGLLRAQLAPYFTMRDLRALTTDKCSTCGAFGGPLSSSLPRDAALIPSHLRPTFASSLNLLSLNWHTYL
ncbi:hypothetical protein F4808DRAFT_135701 [Astrocystis sublimbata]|nr:hypothetical protein F4808DRAFT_135701 [Astrocystis sublimbata]